MKCTICRRELKNPTPSGMGKVCASKAHRVTEQAQAGTPRVELIYDNKRGHRNYLVTGTRRQFVSIDCTAGQRIGRCSCAEYFAGIKCGHLQAVAVEDSSRFNIPHAA